MDIQIHELQDARLIVLNGRLDAGMAGKLEDEFDQHDILEGKSVVINMEKVPVMTADGVRVLLNAHIACQGTDKLKLISPVEEVNQLLTIVGLESLVVNND